MKYTYKNYGSKSVYLHDGIEYSGATVESFDTSEMITMRNPSLEFWSADELHGEPLEFLIPSPYFAIIQQKIADGFVLDGSTSTSKKVIFTYSNGCYAYSVEFTHGIFTELSERD